MGQVLCGGHADGSVKLLATSAIGWSRLVSSSNLWVFFAKESFLQKSPMKIGLFGGKDLAVPAASYSRMEGTLVYILLEVGEGRD